MNGLQGALMSVSHWSRVSLHSGGGRWPPRLPGAWDLTLRSTRDSSCKAEPASCSSDEQNLSKNGVGFRHCTERRVQVKEGSIHIGTADVSPECSEPRGIQMGTTEHDQKIKEPRPSGRGASCLWFLPQKDGPLVGHTIPLLNTDTNPVFGHLSIHEGQQGVSAVGDRSTWWRRVSLILCLPGA